MVGSETKTYFLQFKSKMKTYAFYLSKVQM